MGKGTALTIRMAQRHRKPFLHIDLKEKKEGEAVQAIRQWMSSIKPNILNIAGSRESGAKGIYRAVFDVLTKCFSELFIHEKVN